MSSNNSRPKHRWERLRERTVGIRVEDWNFIDRLLKEDSMLIALMQRYTGYEKWFGVQTVVKYIMHVFCTCSQEEREVILDLLTMLACKYGIIKPEKCSDLVFTCEQVREQLQKALDSWAIIKQLQSKRSRQKLYIKLNGDEQD